MIRKNQQLNWQGQPPPTPITSPTDKISLALLSGISSFPALLHLLTPRGHYTLQTCSKEPLPPLLPSSLPTRDQPPSAPCPRSNSNRWQYGHPVLGDLPKTFPGNRQPQAKQCSSKMNRGEEDGLTPTCPYPHIRYHESPLRTNCPYLP